MLGKKTGVLFTISSVNFELKQGNESPAASQNSPPESDQSPCLSLSLSLSAI